MRLQEGLLFEFRVNLLLPLAVISEPDYNGRESRWASNIRLLGSVWPPREIAFVIWPAGPPVGKRGELPGDGGHSEAALDLIHAELELFVA